MGCKRLLIVEEALRDRKAHWFSYIKTIDDEARKFGWDVNVACHYQATAEVLKEFSAFPVFFASYYLDQGSRRSWIQRKFAFISHNLDCLNAVWTFLKKRPLYDEVFVPTVVAQHLLCWWVIMIFHPRKPKRLTLFFVTNPGRFLEDKNQVVFPKSTIILSFLLGLFKSMVQMKKVRMAVETKRAQKEFESISKIPFGLFPHPVPLQERTVELKNRDMRLMVFSCFGFARHEKGSDLLKNAVEKLVTNGGQSDLKFIIQWTDSFTLPDGGLCTPGEVLSSHEQVKLITAPLNNREYQALMATTDCMILPYRNRSYYARVSRVAIEAACAGIPIIYTRGGWLEELVLEFGSGVGFQDESIDDLLRAIQIMKLGMNDLKSEALLKAEVARKYFSPSNFIGGLLNE